ncbi:glycosyl hydrolases family 11-domain-containing protein [Coprinopsis sp. MPI-PUGE-AT-0042]|nr:glycosyl hydrolases family 11-domain-containing protein [Coprinopsis sp. MPI-PUGE-AT-0042]
MKSYIILASGAFISALANPVLNAREGTPSSSGVHNGFFYLWQSETGTNATYANEDAVSNGLHRPALLLVERVGAQQHEEGQQNGYSLLGVYGWTRKPLVEYWIVESYGYLHPASAAHPIGNTTCVNNGVARSYDLYEQTRVNQPSIDGTQTFKMYWSVRKPNAFAPNLNGTIDTECHFRGWKDGGFEIGEELVYQIFATEGYFSSGNVTMTVSSLIRWYMVQSLTLHWEMASPSHSLRATFLALCRSRSRPPPPLDGVPHQGGFYCSESEEVDVEGKAAIVEASLPDVTICNFAAASPLSPSPQAYATPDNGSIAKSELHHRGSGAPLRNASGSASPATINTFSVVDVHQSYKENDLSAEGAAPKKRVHFPESRE